jgi:hypothetical protein
VPQPGRKRDRPPLHRGPGRAGGTSGLDPTLLMGIAMIIVGVALSISIAIFMASLVAAHVTQPVDSPRKGSSGSKLPGLSPVA